MKKLGVLLSIGESLKLYERMGQKERLEKCYLARYAEKFDEVRLFTYSGDEPALSAPENVKLFSKNIFGPELLYSFIMPLLRWRHFKDLSVIRSLQSIGGLPALIAKKFFGVPYLTTLGFFAAEHYRVERGKLWARFGEKIERAVVKNADAVIVTTDSLKRYALTLTDEERVHFIPNGVELKIFDISKRREPFSERVVTILFVGRLSPQKNLETLIEAASKIPFDYRIVFVGEGERRAELTNLAAKLNVKLELVGVVPHFELPRYYLASDLFVLPSKIEGHPKSLLEAFAAALPCVGARVEGISNFIEDGRSGLLFEHGNADDLFQKICYLHSNPVHARSLGVEARKIVEKNFNLEEIVSREVEILARLAR